MNRDTFTKRERDKSMDRDRNGHIRHRWTVGQMDRQAHEYID